jgi:hypothetical protein
MPNLITIHFARTNMQMDIWRDTMMLTGYCYQNSVTEILKNYLGDAKKKRYVFFQCSFITGLILSTSTNPLKTLSHKTYRRS